MEPAIRFELELSTFNGPRGCGGGGGCESVISSLCRASSGKNLQAPLLVEIRDPQEDSRKLDKGSLPL